MIEGIKLVGLWLSGLDWLYIVNVAPYWKNKILYLKTKYFLNNAVIVNKDRFNKPIFIFIKNYDIIFI